MKQAITADFAQLRFHFKVELAISLIYKLKLQLRLLKEDLTMHTVLKTSDRFKKVIGTIELKILFKKMKSSSSIASLLV